MNRHLGILALFTLSTFSCFVSQTKLIKVYRNEDFSSRLKNVLVIGLGSEVDNRIDFEKKLTSRLNANNISATASYKVMGTDQIITQDSIINAIKGKDYDSVLLTRVVQIKRDENPGSTFFIPKLSYNSLDEASWSKHVLGHTRSEAKSYKLGQTKSIDNDYVEARLETLIYSTKSKELIWSASTRTLDPKTASSAIHTLSKTLITTLKNHFMI